MVRLEEFEATIADERRRDPGGPEAEEIALQLQRAARELLNRQAIHSDDRQLRTSYKLLNRQSYYFESLFDALGYRMRYDATYAYILLLPGEIDTGSRRGRVSKEETMLLFALRVIWEELSRDGEMDDFGRVETDTEVLYDRYKAMTTAELPARTRLKEYLATWKARGLLRLGEEDREEEILTFTITPVIRDLVTEELAEEVMTFLSRPDATAGGDVLEHLRDAEEAAQTRETEDPAPEADAQGSFADV